MPNLAFAVGYTNSSWTSKIGLLCEHFCRLLAFMDEHGHDVCRPVAPEMETRPFLDFGAGYVQRAVGTLPRQGDRTPWLTSMDYSHDVPLLRSGRIDDPELESSRRAADDDQEVAA